MLQNSASSALQEGLRHYEQFWPGDALSYTLLFGIPIVATVIALIVFHVQDSKWWGEPVYSKLSANNNRNALGVGGFFLVFSIIAFLMYAGSPHHNEKYQQALEDSVMENYQVDKVTIVEMPKPQDKPEFFSAKIIPSGTDTVVEAEIVHNIEEDYAMVLKHGDDVIIEPREGSTAAQ